MCVNLKDGSIVVFADRLRASREEFGEGSLLAFLNELDETRGDIAEDLGELRRHAKVLRFNVYRVHDGEGDRID